VIDTPVGDVPSITINYDPVRVVGRLALTGIPSSSIWSRLVSRAIDDPDGRQLSDREVEVPWPAVLGVLRDFGTKAQQQALNFRFKLEGDAQRLARQFAEEVKQAREARNELVIAISPDELRARLRSAGFTRRILRDFQERDLLHLLALPHGANFSVPGAGKTTVTLGLHILVNKPGQHFFVVGPKASFPAWMGVIEECIDAAAAGAMSEQFTILNGSAEENERLLRSGATRFLMSYDLMVRQQSTIASYFARQPVHIVLDEAHRMKAGFDSQRGAFLLNVSPLLMRRDILTGTPMPQGPQDLASQLGFLWPGHGLDLQIQRGTAPREVLGQLYVRTTKSQLGLPEAKRYFRDVPMLPGQMALYGIIRNETLRKLSLAIRGGSESVDFLGARRSVMRLLQLSVNPILALKGITEDFAGIDSGVIDAVLEEGPSSKMRAVADHARSLASDDKKTVIWTIFTDTIRELETLLADLNPVSLYGAVPSGSPDDPQTREGRLKRFHIDDACKVMIANPAAAGEGISLHTVCHNAIYLDRSYVSTHYLQSIDRIHRLGLPPGTETNIYVYRTKAPAQLGSVDYSVSRRLISKIRGLQELLDDEDLKQIALDEECADDPIDYSIELQDLVDLVEELEGHRAPPFDGEAD
jgi:SNF2 family DNA or RNA helicase